MSYPFSHNQPPVAVKVDTWQSISDRFSPDDNCHAETTPATAYSSTTCLIQPSEDYSFFHTFKFKLCFLSMCLNVVLFALDQFIIVVAVPQIVGEFQALDKIEWLNTAFFIPCAGAILIYTQIMTIASPRWTYLVAVIIFEIGSALCAAATSMDMLIWGRAISGLGGAGMWNATYLIGGEVVPFEKRAAYFSLFGASFIFASVMGPLVGGAFTDMSEDGWRWCFYINLPIGAVTLFLLILTLPKVRKLPPFDGQPDHRPLWLKIARIDWVGAALTIGFVTCLGIALQEGGLGHAWSDVEVVCLLFFTGILFIALVGWSLWMGPRSMIPMSLFKRRHFCAGVWVSFLGFGAVVVVLYYLPIYFEAIKNQTAVQAGIWLLGLQMSMCPLLVIAGKFAERTGQAKYLMIFGGSLVAVSSAIYTTLDKETTLGQIIGYQIIAGIGFGCILNIMVVLVQADYLKEQHLIPHVTNVFNFWGFVGRIVSMSTATNIFENQIRRNLRDLGVLPPKVMASVLASPTAIWKVVDPAVRDSVLDVYCEALNKVWWLTLACAAALMFVTLCMRNLNLKQLSAEAVKMRNGVSLPLTPQTPAVARGKSIA